MLVDVSFNAKEQSAYLKFKVEDFKNEQDFSECLAIITIFSGDFYLDPELEISDLEEFISAANSKQKAYLLFDLSEEGLELELV